MAGQLTNTGAWLRAAEAAELLGISEKTVRRKAKAGVLPARQVSTGHGPAWEVWVTGAEPRPATDRAETDTRPGVGRPAVDSESQGDGAMVEALRLIHRLTEENRNLAGQLGYVQSQLQQRDEQLKALTAPTEASTAAHAPESAQEGHQGTSVVGVAVDDHATPVAAPRKAWWRLW